MDAQGKLDMNKRNLYMSKVIQKKLEKVNCEKKIFVNGYRHLMDYTNSKSEQVIGLPSYFKKQLNTKIIFIPSYCKNEISQISKSIPSYFQDLVDSPRGQQFTGDWGVFDRFVVIPKNKNCPKNSF